MGKANGKGKDQQSFKHMMVRIPKDLHRAAKIKAAQEGRSFQEVLSEMVEQWVRQNER